MVDIKQTINEVQQLLQSDPSLPRLTRFVKFIKFPNKFKTFFFILEEKSKNYLKT